MSCLFAISIFCLLPVSAQEDPLPKLEDVIEGMEKLSAESQVEQIGWRVFTYVNAASFTQIFGVETLGRFHREEGIRTVATNLVCGDASAERKAGGPNHYVVVHTAEAVTYAPIMLLIETPRLDDAFPHMLMRSKVGERGHAEVEPELLPAILETLVYANEPTIQFQLAPKIMFKHEPKLAVTGWTAIEGKKYVTLSSQRDAGALFERMPKPLNAVKRMKKRFFIEPGTWLLAGMEYDVARFAPTEPGGVSHTRYRMMVKSRRSFRGGPEVKTAIALPEDVEMTELSRNIHQAMVVKRTMEFQTGEFP
jgi:hypothetical protein